MKKLVLALLCIFALSTCKKEDPKQPDAPPVVTITKGNLKGKVNYYDQFGKIYTDGLNTTTVSIEGQGFTTVTDTAGSYTLTGVPGNTYTLLFEKAGCGLIKLENIIYKFTDTVTYNANIADIPTFSITSAYAKDTTWFSGSLSGIYYHASVSPANPKASVVAIIGKSQNMDIADPMSYLNYATASFINVTDFHRFFSYPLLKDTYTFEKGTIVYLKIYPVSAIGASYFDDNSKIPIFTAFGRPYPTVFALTVK